MACHCRHTLCLFNVILLADSVGPCVMGADHTTIIVNWHHHSLLWPYFCRACQVCLLGVRALPYHNFGQCQLLVFDSDWLYGAALTCAWKLAKSQLRLERGTRNKNDNERKNYPGKTTTWL